MARGMLPLAPVQFPHTLPIVVTRGTYVFPVVDASANLARDERALEIEGARGAVLGGCLDFSDDSPKPAFPSTSSARRRADRV